MSDLGARLRSTREELGVPLRDIATRTKISVGTLEALERNDFTRLPGGIFGRAFVRAYALELGLDPDTTVADFQEHLEQSEREAAARGAARVEITRDDLEFLERQRQAVRALRIGLIVLIVGAILLLAWQLRLFWRAPSPAEEGAAPSTSLEAPTGREVVFDARRHGGGVLPGTIA